jgi:pimeloyl-ACP methyl ester carboxylesterase
MAPALGPRVIARQSRALRDGADRQAALASYRGPDPVRMGAEDRLCPRDRRDLMHDLMPQFRPGVVEGAGHLPTLGRLIENAAALRRWLAD